MCGAALKSGCSLSATIAFQLYGHEIDDASVGFTFANDELLAIRRHAGCER